MKIEEALKLKVGDTVFYPEDRGNPKGYSKVTYVSELVCRNAEGTEYIWVNLKIGGVWPSNRLGMGWTNERRKR